MSSLLMKCQQCHAMIAKGQICPQCHWSDSAGDADSEADAAPAQDSLREYERRERRHMRNYAIYMSLMLGTGLIGLLTAGLWIRFIFMGSIRAFFLIVLLSIVTAGLGVVLAFAKKICPTELNCPGCDLRLDQMGTIGHHCPNCSAQLKATA